MRDPFTPDFIETPIAPEPAAPVPPVQPSQPVPPFPHRPARSMAVAMLAGGLRPAGTIPRVIRRHLPAGEGRRRHDYDLGVWHGPPLLLTSRRLRHRGRQAR